MGRVRTSFPEYEASPAPSSAGALPPKTGEGVVLCWSLWDRFVPIDAHASVTKMSTDKAHNLKKQEEET